MFAFFKAWQAKRAKRKFRQEVPPEYGDTFFWAPSKANKIARSEYSIAYDLFVMMSAKYLIAQGPFYQDELSAFYRNFVKGKDQPFYELDYAEMMAFGRIISGGMVEGRVKFWRTVDWLITTGEGMAQQFQRGKAGDPYLYQNGLTPPMMSEGFQKVDHDVREQARSMMNTPAGFPDGRPLVNAFFKPVQSSAGSDDVTLQRCIFELSDLEIELPYYYWMEIPPTWAGDVPGAYREKMAAQAAA